MSYPLKNTKLQTSNATSVTEVRSTSTRLFGTPWHALLQHPIYL